MGIEGKIKTLYSDRDEPQAIFPRTKVNAISDNDGIGLDAILEDVIYSGPATDNSVSAPINADTLGGRPASEYATNEKVDALTYSDVGAAPAGYGLGGYTTRTIYSISELDNITANGWYKFYQQGAGLNNIWFNYAYFRVSNYGEGSHCLQELYPIGSNTPIVRCMFEGVWSAWESVNPPMEPSVEYRTTERWNGKPVYTVLINCGTLPSAGATNIIAIPSPIYGTIDKIIRCGGTTSEGNLIPFTWNGEYMIIASATRSSIFIYSRVENGSNTATIQLWYTKW